MNPQCPKCGQLMETKEQTLESRTTETGQKIWGISKFWVCPNKSLLHGRVRYRKGSQVIPPYKSKEEKK